MHHLSKPNLVAAAFLALAATPRAGDLWVVAPDHADGADFAEIDAAVAAAASGDTILVKDGDYKPFFVTQKSLVIVAEAGEHPRVKNGVASVRGLSVDQFFVMRGIDVNAAPPVAGTPNPNEVAVVLKNNVGPVWIEDGTFEGADDPDSECDDGAFQAVVIEGCAAVTFARCRLEGGRGAPAHSFGCAGSGASAMSTTASDVALYECTVLGGNGGLADFGGADGGWGGGGVRNLGGLVFAAGTSFVGGQGGDGGWNSFGACGDGGWGGDAVQLAAAAADFQHLECTFDAGLGGANGCTGSAPDGEPVDVGLGSETVLAGSARGFDITSPVREQETATLTLRGIDGDLVFALVSSDPMFLYLPALVGTLNVAPPLFTLPVGVLPSSGELAVVVQVGNLGPAASALTLLVQPLFGTTAGTAVLGGPSQLLVLDAAL